MKLAIFFYCVLSSCIGFSQSLITGRVTDSDTDEPLIGAHIYLLNDWRKGIVTDINGEFRLVIEEENVQDSLIVSFVGFNELVLPIYPEMDIQLDPIKIEGETVVVTAKPLIAEEFKYVEINKIEIYTNPAAKADPILAVNSLPSSTTTDESANISLRGSSPIETGIYFNNVPIYDAVRYSQLNGIGTFSIFNTDIIKAVTVFPGNPPLEFGNATSGIIALNTDDRVLTENTNSLILSLANIGLSRQQKISENSSVKVFSNWQPSGPIKGVNPEALDEIKSFTSNDLGVYYYGSNSNLTWKLLGYGVTEGYQFNFKHPSFQGIFDQEKQRSFLIGTLERSLKNGVIT
ncbi:MAG: carboxypeptidase-like regulatory domain-containing protein, partial [Bacteroidota bacterium]